ncbi:unnamed protein product [Ixodes pacificus]
MNPRQLFLASLGCLLLMALPSQQQGLLGLMATAAIMRRFRGGNGGSEGGQNNAQQSMAHGDHAGPYGLASQAIPFYAGAGYPGAYGGALGGPTALHPGVGAYGGFGAPGFGAGAVGAHGGYPGGSAGFVPGAPSFGAGAPGFGTGTPSFGAGGTGFGGAAAGTAGFAPGGFGGLPVAGGVPYTG